MSNPLEDIETADLIEELESRGHTVDEETELCDFTTSELRDELEDRGESISDTDFSAFFSTPAGAEWLRSANPPQELRDAYWNEFGRIL